MTGLRELQSERLRALARYVYERVGLYRERFDEAGVRPDDVRSLDDLRQASLHAQDRPPRPLSFGLFAVPRAEVARIHGSSGTTGKPTVVGYTRSGPRPLRRGQRPQSRDGGCRAGDDAPQLLRLRPVHRRARAPLRRRAARDDGRARLRWHDRAAAAPDHRLSPRHDRVHARLRTHARAGVREPGRRSGRAQPPLRRSSARSPGPRQ